MARNGPNEHLQKVLKENPEWIDEAREALSGWESGRTFLMPVIALALKAAYERGLQDRQGSRRASPTPPTPKPTPTPPKATAKRVRRVR